MNSYSAINDEVFAVQNEFRQNPKMMIPHLEARLKKFQGNKIM